MKEYRSAMDCCGPDAQMEARLMEQVLAAGKPKRSRKIYRPRSFGRKLLLAAVLAAALTASVGAALTQVPWDQIFADRFGPGAAATETAVQAFQEVNVTAVCGDVTLTLRQAVGDDKTIYLILDLQLPQTADVEEMEQVMASQEAGVWLQAPQIDYYATDDVAWDDIRGLTFEEAQGVLHPHRLIGNRSGSVSEAAFDPETRTVTYLLSCTWETDSATDLTAQPLTLLVGAPLLCQNGEETPLTDHPAIITFTPDYVQRAHTYALRDAAGTLKYTVSLSPFALSAESFWGNYTSLKEFAADVRLVNQDGTEWVPGRAIGWGGSGSKPTDSEVYTTVSFSCRFHEILDLSTVAAIRAGELEIPITDWVE